MKPVLLTLCLSACSATMVNSPGGSPSAYAPTNEAARPGMVKYLNQGWNSVIASRRENAYRQMYGACRGPYQITSEGPRAEGGTVIQGAYVESQYWYIQFACGPAAP